MDRIAGLLEEKHGLYLRLRQNLLTFRETLHGEEGKEMEALIRQRERIMRAVDALDQKLSEAGYPHRLKKSVEGDSGQAVVSNWTDRLKALWQEIFALNNECLEYAEDRCRDLRQEITSFKQEVQGVKKYAAQGQASPRFINTVR